MSLSINIEIETRLTKILNLCILNDTFALLISMLLLK